MSKNTSHLLINENPLQVLPSLATLVGLNEAIALQQVHYWIEHYRKAEEEHPESKRYHFKPDSAGKDRSWVYNSYAEWRESNFPFWSETTIRRAFKSLEKKGLLISEQLSEDKHDRTNWYTIDYKKLNGLNAETEPDKDTHESTPDNSPEESQEDTTSDQMHVSKMTTWKEPEWPTGLGQDDPMINGTLTETTQRVEEEVNDGSAIGDTAATHLVIDPDLTEAATLFEHTGRELTQDVLTRFEQMAERGADAAQANGETGGGWLNQALNLALGKAKPQSVLNYADKVIGGWVERGYRIRRRKRSTGEELSPELDIFQQATGRLPLPDQRNIAISLIHQHAFTSADLRPFWEAWVARDKRRSDMTWLTDWAAKGEIPQPSRGKRKKTPDGISPAVANYVKKQTPGEH